MIFANRRPGNVEINENNMDLYFDYNAEQLVYKSDIIDNIIKNDTNTSILEVMGGLGQISFEILTKCVNKNVVIQEEKKMFYNHINSTIAKEQLSERCKVILSSSYQFPFEAESFSLIYSINSLHRMYHPVETIGEMYRVLKPGGRIILSDLRRDLIEDFADYRIKELKSVKNADWMIKNFVNSWGASYTLTEVEHLLESAGITKYKVSEDGVVALFAEISK